MREWTEPRVDTVFYVIGLNAYKCHTESWTPWLAWGTKDLAEPGILSDLFGQENVVSHRDKYSQSLGLDMKKKTCFSVKFLTGTLPGEREQLWVQFKSY